jgi:signal transduction histidine kinase
LKAGNKTLFITTIRDMTFWVDYVKQKKVTNLRTVAFASAAHEFRNPLNAIIASLENLYDKIDH